MGTRKVTWHRWEEMPRERLSETLERRLITGERIMLAHVYIKKGAVVPRHAHENEQLTYILEGALRFRLGEDGSEVVDVRAGEVLCIPPNVPHQPRNLSATEPAYAIIARNDPREQESVVLYDPASE